MAVDEQGVLAAVAGLQLCDDVLDVAIVVGEAVGEFEVERPARLLEIDGDLMDRFGSLLDGSQLTPDEIDRQNFVFVAP